MMEIRLMTKEDVPFVAKLENETFAEPWSEKSLLDFLEHNYAYFFVADVNGEIAGYIGSYKAGTSMDITNVAVFENHRRKGIAASLVKAVINNAKEKKCEMVNLEVRESNEKAIRLYEKEGFKTIGIRKNFYSKPTENAIIYQYEFCEI